MENTTHLSKFISLILRHKPQVIGVSLDEHGWAEIEQLLNGINQNGKYQIDRALLERIVREDDKQRYQISTDGQKIRACQGHSIHVNIEMEKKQPPSILFHGTAAHNVDSILSKGILPNGRLYVHLSKDEQTAVKVGQRHGKPVVLQIKAGDMYQEGYEFYISENGVWQTKIVPQKFIIFPSVRSNEV